RPTSRARSPRSWVGRSYPSTSRAVSTDWRVPSDTPGLPLRTRLTVASLTPTFLATSASRRVMRARLTQATRASCVPALLVHRPPPPRDSSAQPHRRVRGQPPLGVQWFAGQEQPLVRGQTGRRVGEVDDAQQPVRAREGEHVPRGGEPGQRTVPEAVLEPAQPQGPTVEREHRPRVGALPVDRVRSPVRGLGQPRVVPGPEAVPPRLRLPRWGLPAAVAPRIGPPGTEVQGVLDPVERYVRLGQAQFLPLVDVDRPGQGQGEQGRRTGP